MLKAAGVSDFMAREIEYTKAARFHANTRI